MRYKYLAYTSANTLVKGTIDAATESMAEEALE
jgi:hypothetical protein